MKNLEEVTVQAENRQTLEVRELLRRTRLAVKWWTRNGMESMNHSG